MNRCKKPEGGELSKSPQVERYEKEKVVNTSQKTKP